MIKQFYLSKFNLLCNLFAINLNVKVIFEPSIGANQVLPLQARLDLGAMAR